MLWWMVSIGLEMLHGLQVYTSRGMDLLPLSTSCIQSIPHEWSQPGPFCTSAEFCISLSPVDALLKKTDAALSRLERKQPNRVSGKSMFLKDLCSRMASNQQLTQAQKTEAMARHSTLFLRLPLPRQKEYCGQAELQAQAKVEELELEAKHLQSRMAGARARLAE